VRAPGVLAAITIGIAIASSSSGCRHPIDVQSTERVASVAAEGIAELRVELACGSLRVEVEGGNRASIDVVARRFASGKSDREAQERLERMRVLTSKDAEGVLGLRALGSEQEGCGVDLDIRTPRGVRIVAATGRGSIEAHDLEASARLRSLRGNVDVRVRPAPGSHLEAVAEDGTVTCRVPRYLAARYSLQVERGALRTESGPFRIPPGLTSFSTATGADPTSILLRARGGDVVLEGG
jgi:hypothetical protein